MAAAERTWSDASPIGARVVERDEVRSRECLVRLQVTPAQRLVGWPYNCGGIVVDHGWLRILGGGHEGLHSLSVNHLPESKSILHAERLLLVDDLVLGGTHSQSMEATWC